MITSQVYLMLKFIVAIFTIWESQPTKSTLKTRGMIISLNMCLTCVIAFAHVLIVVCNIMKGNNKHNLYTHIFSHYCQKNNNNHIEFKVVRKYVPRLETSSNDSKVFLPSPSFSIFVRFWNFEHVIIIKTKLVHSWWYCEC